MLCSIKNFLVPVRGGSTLRNENIIYRYSPMPHFSEQNNRFLLRNEIFYKGIITSNFIWEPTNEINVAFCNFEQKVRATFSEFLVQVWLYLAPSHQPNQFPPKLHLFEFLSQIPLKKQLLLQPTNEITHSLIYSHSLM